MRDDERTQTSCERHDAGAGLAIGRHLTPRCRPGTLDVDRAGLAGEVKIGPAQRAQLTAPKSAVDRSRPQRALTVGKGADQLVGLLASRDALTPPPTRWNVKVSHRIDHNLATAARPPVESRAAGPDGCAPWMPTDRLQCRSSTSAWALPWVTAPSAFTSILEAPRRRSGPPVGTGRAMPHRLAGT